MKIEELLNEASSALADIAEALDEGVDTTAIEDAIRSVAKALSERKPDDFKGIADAIRAMKIEAPQVTVNVQPTPVHVNLPALAPVFEMPMRESTGFDVTVKTDMQGNLTRLIVRPLKD